MEIKDAFPYEARWDTVGLCCAFCQHQANAEWPNMQRDYRCALHNVSLAAEIGPNGYMTGEWFCRDFVDNGRAYPAAVKHLETVRSQLPARVLFGFYGEGGNLKQMSFEELDRSK